MLDPIALSKITNLTLRARRVVEGVFSGLHQSRHHGSSVEFAEHKDYSPGDEIRHIDWRLFAKSNKLYVKRFEHETNLRATILLDATASMEYGDGALTKWDYARTLAASLAYLLLDQRDAVGLALFGDGITQFVPPRSGRRHLRALIDILESAQPGGPGTAAVAVDALAQRIPPRGMVVLVTDALEELPPLQSALRRLRHRGHDVNVLQVLDTDEVDFPFDELTLFQSMEDAREVLVDPSAARGAYLEALASHCRELTMACRAHEIDHRRLRTDEALDQALVGFLARRAA